MMLRALERDEIMRVGDPQPIKIDVRLITATNKNLQEQVSKVTFRKDLFYRLYVIPLTLPPQRERREDIPLLIDHFLKKKADKSGKGPHRISDEAMALFMNYSYPGNIRELENLIERSMPSLRPSPHRPRGPAHRDQGTYKVPPAVRMAPGAGSP